MRVQPRGCKRSVDRGVSRPGIERRKPSSGCRCSLDRQKAIRKASLSRDARRPRVVVDPGMLTAFCTGTGRSPSLSPPAVAGISSGRPGAVADEHGGEVGLAQGSKEAGEQGGFGRGGACGAKGRGQGECGTAKHGPDSEPGSRVTGAVGAKTSSGELLPIGNSGSG